MSDRSRKRLAGLVIIFLMLIGDLIVGFADSPSTPNTFTKAVADTLYCTITSANCLNNYCNTPGLAVTIGSDNCNQAFSGGNGGYCPNGSLAGLVAGMIVCTSSNFVTIHTTSDNATKRTMSSSIFTTYTKALGSAFLPVATDFNSHQVYCNAFAQIQSSNILAVVDVRVSDTIQNLNGKVWRVNTLVANDNFTISYASLPLGTILSNAILSLQFSITGTGSITVYHAVLDCFEIDALAAGIVG